MAPVTPPRAVLLRMRRLITDFRHKNRDETDMIMVKIREMRIWRQAPGRRVGSA